MLGVSACGREQRDGILLHNIFDLTIGLTSAEPAAPACFCRVLIDPD